jgi:ribosomal protein S10
MANSDSAGVFESFKQNCLFVIKLMSFDVQVIDFVEAELVKLEEALGKKFKNDMLLPKRALVVIRGIRDEESLKMYYETIYNQCVVLLVSYFGSAVQEILETYINKMISGTEHHKLKREEIKINVSELAKLTGGTEISFGEMIINQRNISFQDMGSIHRFIRDIMGSAPENDETVNDIIFGQAARHIIVHRGSIIDARFMNQIANVKPRTLLPEVNLGGKITFRPEDVTVLRDAMLTYLSRIIDITSMKMPAEFR